MKKKTVSKNRKPSKKQQGDAEIEIKEVLKETQREQEFEGYKEGQINWLDSDFYDLWDKIKGHCKNLWKHKKEYNEGTWKKFFLAHSKDTITGKPQLIDQVQKKIPLVRQAIKKFKPKKNDPDFLYVNPDGTVDIQSFYFFDEKFDARHDGFQRDAFALDFWTYRVISGDQEYYILSQQELPNESYTFKGMLVEFDDFTEFSRSMRLRSLSRIFFLREFEPNVKILAPDQIVSFTKKQGLTEKAWLDFLAFHPLGTQNRFPMESEMLQSSWILSGKVDGYPLHLAIIGPPGTRKSKGYIECKAWKFGEDHLIVEGGNSRLKGLTPSFKEKPANLGYLAKAERIGFIDEIGKMVEQRMHQDNLSSSNLLGEANFLLDHSKRLVGSGNDNDAIVQATGKFLFVSNPIAHRPTIYAHVGVFDPTFMSRILWWIQDPQEQEFVLSEKGIVRPPDNTKTSPDRERIVIENRKKDIVLKMCYRNSIVENILSLNNFIILFDSCYSFVSIIDDSKVQELAKTITLLAKEPMKGVWRPRAEHLVKLLVDGICKHRCLFKDYDSSFQAKKEDFDLAERILIRMVKSWDTELGPKEYTR